LEIKIENITKRFTRGRREFTVLDNISATIPDKKFVVITGDSGVGKSTLLNILSGLMRPTSGKVLYEDKEITGLNDRDLSSLRIKDLGIVNQSSDLISYLTLEENLSLSREISGREGAEETDQVLRRLGLYDLKSSYPEEMSGGEIKRAAIARAILVSPEVLIMDEPTANLDRKNVRNVLSLLKEQQDKGKTVVISSHEEEALEYCDINIDLEKYEKHGT
jgi:ABC-type lipoprotein export system ATPase subunit